MFMKKHTKLICLLLIVLFLFSSCFSIRELRYYKDKDNYVTTTGIITKISYNEDHSILYLSIDHKDQLYSDNNFKIIPENFTIAKNKGIENQIHVGDTITFVSAPRYFGDGYVMPILALSIDGNEFLSFEEGYPNFIKWLKKHP